MGGTLGKLGLGRKPSVCPWCGRPVAPRKWWLPRRFCNGWHQAKFRTTSFFARVLDNLL
ncbi:hypothetical protein ACWGF2_36385 [Streptomyces sp. NPDC054919]